MLRSRVSRARVVPWCAAALLLLSGAARAERVALIATADNTLIESVSGDRSNGAGPHFFVGRTGQSTNSIRRGLLAFDVAAALPPGAEVEAVQLVLNLSQANAAPATVTLHRALAGWGEGASSFPGGQGAAAEPGDATWIHRFYDGLLWDLPGGDFAAPASAGALVEQVGTYVWDDPGLVQDVQLWLDLPSANHGWVVRGDESSANSAKRFDSREFPAGIPPLLLVRFTPPTIDDDGDDESDDESGDDESADGDSDDEDSLDDRSLRGTTRRDAPRSPQGAGALAPRR